MNAIDLLQRLWTATLALSAALVIVAALRTPWRRWFGVEHACRLWWLPLFALIASQLPHAQPHVVVTIVPAVLHVAAQPAPAPMVAATAAHWRPALAILWICGACAALLVALLRQQRFLRALRGAEREPVAMPHGISEVLRAGDAATGPALVGIWKPRLILPRDFEQRYDARECALILAHEAMHARRRDGLVGAMATLLHALFWFHPLAWWALSRLRRDQELACDAAVLRDRPRARRYYAQAMLKAQFAGTVLPAGSFWPSHPIRERIIMLKLPVPGGKRRIIGGIIAGSLAASVSMAVWAAAQPPARTVVRTTGGNDTLASARSPDARTSQYQLALHISRGGQWLANAPIVCMGPGGSASISQVESQEHDTWSFDVSLHMEMADSEAQVAVDGSLASGNTSTPLHARLRGPLGQPMALRVDGEHGGPSTELQIVPTRGCSAHVIAPPPPPPPLPPPPPPPPPLPPAPPHEVTTPSLPAPPAVPAAVQPEAASSSERR